MNKKISYAHCICGDGLKDHFENSINSILFYDPGSFLIILNTSYKSDIDLDKYLFDVKNKNNNIELINIEHVDQKTNKTGSLINGLNKVIDFAYEKKIKYLNVLQNDQQMIWMGKKIFDFFEEIFNYYPQTIQIANSANRLGSHPDIFKNQIFKERVFFSKTFKKNINLLKHNFSSIGDTGILSVNRIKENKIKYEINETFTGKKYLDQKYELLFTPFPLIFFIPWPRVIRNKKEIGISKYPKNKKNEFMIVSKHNSIFEFLLKRNSPKIWHEDLVCSNGFLSFYPSWFSDGWYWYLKILLKNRKKSNLFKRFYWEGYINGKYFKKNIFFFFGLIPRYPNVILYFIHVLFTYIKNKLKINK